MWKLIGIIAILTAVSGTTVHAQRDRGDLVLLGEQTVGFNVDRDIIRIGHSEDWYANRTFRALHFVSERNDVLLRNIRLVYLNGYSEEITVDRAIPQGRDLVVDLGGERSYIQQIEMVYRSPSNARGRALIQVYGEPRRDVAQRLPRPREPLPRGPGLDEFVLLGERTVGFEVDRDVIDIGQPEDWYRDRSFRALHFTAGRNDILLISLRLVYLNGYSEEIAVDQVIPEGGDLPVDLRGERSYFKQIEMIYRSGSDDRRRAVIRVFGQPAGVGSPPLPPDRGGDWVELGCQRVSLFRRDRDTIRVGRREGRFRAIRLDVNAADVEIIDLKVIYANGQTDDIPVRHFIRAGERTRPLDLRGPARRIDRVNIIYRSTVRSSDIVTGRRINVALVCVQGLL